MTRGLNDGYHDDPHDYNLTQQLIIGATLDQFKEWAYEEIIDRIGLQNDNIHSLSSIGWGRGISR
jgi:hypothetical protein